MAFTDSCTPEISGRILAGALAVLPLVMLPGIIDGGEPARFVALGAVLAVVFFCGARAGTLGPFARRAAITLGLAATAYVVAALVNHPASSLFGVHGRFEGMVAAGVFALSGVAGYLTLGRQMRFLARALGIAVTLEGLIIVVQRVTGGSPAGTLVNPVMMGAWLAVAVAVVIASALFEKGNVRVLLLVASAFGTVGLGLLGSRGAWVGLIAGLLALAPAARSGGVRRLALAGVVVLGLLIGIVAGGPAVLAKLSATDVKAGSAATRLMIWSGAVRMTAEHPLTGVGPGRFVYEYPRYQAERHATIEGPDVRTDEAHSVFLQTGAESGVVTLALLLALFGITGWAAVAAVRAGDGTALLAAAGFAAFTAQGIFGISTIATDGLAWALGGVLLARADARSAGADARKPAAQQPILHGISTLVAVTLFVLGVYYVGYDVAYARGVAALERADFTTAWQAASQSVRGNPTVDLYRVAAGDVARFMAATGDVATGRAALASVEQGLRLEPDSYDLALARARLLRSTGADAAGVLAAYEEAVNLYPLGYTVRLEAAAAADASGDATRAASLRAAVTRTYPGASVGGAVR